jgi:beta-glucosidase
MAGIDDTFLWGTSQSGHSIEGENFASDWWRWEQRPGRIAGGGTSREGADFMHRFARDLALARDLGHNAFLFSLEWSRIELERGTTDGAALACYREVFEALRANALEPICVLQHVTVPRWFYEAGGWRREESVGEFRAYVERVIAEFAPFCRYWIPIREPMHWITMACMERKWPGPPRKIFDAVACLEHMTAAHIAAYRAIHAWRDDALVGAGVHARRFFPADANSPWDVRTQRRETRRCDGRFLRDVEGAFDFIGLAYYGREYVRFAPFCPTTLFARLTDEHGRGVSGPEYKPDAQGLVETVEAYREFNKPMLITANGFATDDDMKRSAYIVEHSRAVERVRTSGAPLMGYLYRSLLDGFEWEAGYTRRFGLVHVDRGTQSRTPNPSAFLFRELCRTGTISPGAVARYCPEIAAEAGAGRTGKRRKGAIT